jgi:hypothetical protein
VAEILLSLNVVIAAVERSNKEFSIQKSKKRNRLTDERATKLTYIAYNLKTQRWSDTKGVTNKHLDLTNKLNLVVPARLSSSVKPDTSGISTSTTLSTTSHIAESASPEENSLPHEFPVPSDDISASDDDISDQNGEHIFLNACF